MEEKKTVSVKVVAKFRDKEDLSVVHEAGEVLNLSRIVPMTLWNAVWQSMLTPSARLWQG